MRGRSSSTAISLALLLLVGCVAPGNYEDRARSYNTTVELRGAGDEQCSNPAPFISFRACLVHDAAYELARKTRCREGDDPFNYTTEQARFIADLNLAYTMAQDGYPEWWTATYFIAVRLGGWWPWYFGDCKEENDAQGIRQVQKRWWASSHHHEGVSEGEARVLPERRWDGEGRLQAWAEEGEMIEGCPMVGQS